MELYLKTLTIFPVPNSVQMPFKFDVPKTIIISRRDTVFALEQKIKNLLSNILYAKGEKSIVMKIRIWKSLTNNLDEIKAIDEKWKNSSVCKIDAECLTSAYTDIIK